MASRSGTAEWKGGIRDGEGQLSLASGAFEGRYSFTTRFGDEPGTNPEELIGAAHAACFSMALGLILEQAGHPADSVRTTADVVLRQVDGNPTITRIDLKTEGRVPGVESSQFKEYAAQAKAGCPVSRALSGVEEITLDATLHS